MQAFRADEPNGIFYAPDRPGRRRRLLPRLPRRTASRRRTRGEGKRLRLRRPAPAHARRLYTVGVPGRPDRHRHRGRPVQAGDDLQSTRRGPIAEITQTTTYINGDQRSAHAGTVKNTSSGPLTGTTRSRAPTSSSRATTSAPGSSPRARRDSSAARRRHRRSGGFVEVRSRAVAGLVGLPGAGRSAAPRPRSGQDPGRAPTASDGTPFRQHGHRRAGGQRRRGRVGRRRSPTARPPPALELLVRSALPAALQLNPRTPVRRRACRSPSPRPPRTPPACPSRARRCAGRSSAPTPARGATTIGAGGKRGDRSGHQRRRRHGHRVRRPQQQRHPRAGGAAGARRWALRRQHRAALRVKVTGDRRSAGGQASRWSITVNCDSPATVTSATTSS